MQPAETSRAVTATVSLAFELGLSADDATVIQNSNRLAVRLMPCGVLARVAAPVRRNHEVAAFELKVARRIGVGDHPVGVLEPRVEPLMYVRDGFAITLWTYYEPVPDGEIAPADYAHALARLHAALRQFDGAAPHFTDRVDEAQAIVRDSAQSPDLSDADRELLIETLRTRRKSVVDRGADEQLVHGEPHLGNLLTTASGLRFVDFETCCYGPVEFDIAHAPDEVGEHYAPADQRLLRDCRILMLAMVAAWRADRGDEFPNGRAMLDELVRRIRETVDDDGIALHG